MNLVRLFQMFPPAALWRLLGSAALSALASTAVLAIVNASAQQIAAEKADGINPWAAALFCVAIAAYWVSESRMVAWMAADLETAIHQLRMNLLGKLRRADFQKLESFGEAELYKSISQSCQVISQNSHFLAVTVHSVILAGLILAYIATVSPLAFALIGGMLGLGAAAYVRLGRQLDAQQARLMVEEALLFESVSDLFDGFKEQRLNSARSRALNESFGAVSDQATLAANTVHLHTWRQFVFGETVFNLMLGVVVFIVPVYTPAFGEELARVVAAVLFLTSPVFALMQTVAVMRAADAAARRMFELDAALEELAEAELAAIPAPAAFSTLRLADVAFRYASKQGDAAFGVGPCNLAVAEKEALFITGGNGSGKSTLLKLLTGLYRPHDGRLLLDETTIGRDRLADYRTRIATVFGDFHLFPRLYRPLPQDGEKVKKIFELMEMRPEEVFDGVRFRRRDLSTGQSKRLALLAALLEDKPILVLDEWAADQDPEFRKKFYHVILPALRDFGLLIVAVTHDEHYFQDGDRHLNMADGRLSPPSRLQEEATAP